MEMASPLPSLRQIGGRSLIPRPTFSAAFATLRRIRFSTGFVWKVTLPYSLKIILSYDLTFVWDNQLLTF